MKSILTPLVFATFLLLGACEATPSHAQDKIIKPQLIEQSQDERDIAAIARKIYQTKSREYVCFWKEARIKGNFRKKFSGFFSEEILKQHFDTNNCLQVASARRGFTLLDDESLWSDNDIYKIALSKPTIVSNRATIEVRIWSTFFSRKDKPSKDSDGGVIVYFIKTAAGWRACNIAGSDELGAKPFNLLIESSDWQTPPWKDVDYSTSLSSPKPLK